MANDGGPAFPVTIELEPDVFHLMPGMSLRDYFAAKAMGAMDACEYEKFEHMAADAYKIADAMLAAREAK